VVQLIAQRRRGSAAGEVDIVGLYDALVGVGIKPYDLECLHAFLVAHAGHRLFLSSDHDDPKDWPAELRELDDDERYDWEREGTPHLVGRRAMLKFVSWARSRWIPCIKGIES
jgi:hypothetical protein